MAEILQSLEERQIFRGAGKKFKCAFCGGSGKQPHSTFSRCVACRGKGEVEFKGQFEKCPSCRGKGKAPGSAILSCIRCRGVGAVEKDKKAGEDTADIIKERLGEVTEKLKKTKEKAEKKTKEIKKRLKPVRPLIKEISARGRSALGGKKETSWLNLIKEEWKSIWKIRSGK